MKTRKNKPNNRSALGKMAMIILLCIGTLMSCSKGDDSTDEGGYASSYSGNGNFNFSGDFDMPFIGSVQNVQIGETNGMESLPLSFRDGQGKEFFIGLRSNPLQTREYVMKEIGTEGYAIIELGGEIYDTGAIGGVGTVTLTTLNRNKIKGNVDMRLARPLNTADTVVVVGSFELNAN